MWFAFFNLYLGNTTCMVDVLNAMPSLILKVSIHQIKKILSLKHVVSSFNKSIPSCEWVNSATKINMCEICDTTTTAIAISYLEYWQVMDYL